MTKFLKKPLGLLTAHKIVSLIVLIALIAAAAKYARPSTWFNSDSSKKVVVAGNPVPAPSTNKPSAPAAKTPTANAGGLADGTATDTHGTSAGSNDPSKWVTSASGLITVKSPVANSTLHSGDIIAGSAKVSQISYRLKDNLAGKIAEGTLSVVNGNFSGKLSFSHQGTGGQLDIFTTNDLGVEYNEVQINVSF